MKIDSDEIKYEGWKSFFRGFIKAFDIFGLMKPEIDIDDLDLGDWTDSFKTVGDDLRKYIPED